MILLLSLTLVWIVGIYIELEHVVSDLVAIC